MQNNQIEIIGSDNRKYLIETERSRRRGGYPMLDLSIIPVKTEVDYDDFKYSNIDISKNIVEQYIQSIRQQYEPDRRRIFEIREILNSSVVNNHFDYLHVLSRLKPRFTDLLQ